MATRINLRNWKLFKAWRNFRREIAREFSRYRVYASIFRERESPRNWTIRLVRKHADTTTYYFHDYQHDKYLSADKRDLEFARKIENKMVYRFLDVDLFCDCLPSGLARTCLRESYLRYIDYSKY